MIYRYISVVFKSLKINNRAYNSITGQRETFPGLPGEPRRKSPCRPAGREAFRVRRGAPAAIPPRCPAPRPPPPGPPSAAGAAGAAAAAIGLKIASSLPLPSLGPGSRRRPAPGPAARRLHRPRRAARQGGRAAGSEGGRAAGREGKGGKEDAAGRALPRRRCADGLRGPGRAARPLHAHDPGAQVRGPGLQDGMCLLLRLARECSDPPPAASAPPPAAAPSPPRRSPSPPARAAASPQAAEPALALPPPAAGPRPPLLPARGRGAPAHRRRLVLPAFVCLFSSFEAL